MGILEKVAGLLGCSLLWSAKDGEVVKPKIGQNKEALLDKVLGEERSNSEEKKVGDGLKKGCQFTLATVDIEQVMVKEFNIVIMI